MDRESRERSDEKIVMKQFVVHVSWGWLLMMSSLFKQKKKVLK